jgi:cytidylate kinase
MRPTNPADHWGATFQHLAQHWEHRRQEQASAPSPPPAFTVALTREAGALGTSVAQEVGRRLGWPVYDHSLMEQIAEDLGVRTNLVESVDERRKSWLLEMTEHLLAVPTVSETAYLRRLLETVLALGAHGECVIVGRGAAFVLPPETTLRVRLVAPLEERVKVLAERLGLSQQEAERKAVQLDRARADFVRQHFRKDPADPLNYDLFVNASRFTPAAAAACIVEALRDLQVSVANRQRPAK